MAELVYTGFMSLDGVVDSPGGKEEGHRSGGWVFETPFVPEAFALKAEELEETTALMFGRHSYEIFAPTTCALQLRTRVGAIAVSGIAGPIVAETAVGAIELTGIAGPVDAKTEVGAIRIKTPPQDASFDLRTALGSIHTDVPGARVESTTFLGRKLVVEGAGPKIHAETSVGAIDLIL